MKSIILSIFFVFISTFLISANSSDKNTDAPITNATVFINGAQVVRQATVQLEQGTTIVHLKNLSPYIDKESIQVKGEGGFTVMSVNHQNNYIDQLTKPEQIKTIQDQIEKLDKQTEDEKTWLDILAEKESFLTTNKDIGGKNEIMNPQTFNSLNEIYSENIKNIKLATLERTRKIRDYEKEKAKLNKQLNELRAKKELPSGEINVTLSAKSPVKGKLRITYLVGNAGWYPSYDLRVDRIDQPVSLVYKANVHQNTGVEWKNVKLKFSNATPDQSGSVPILTPWYLRYYTPVYSALQGRAAGVQVTRGSYNAGIRQVSGIVTDDEGQPLPGATILIKGTTVGTVSDVDGRYSISIPANGNILVYSFVGYETQEIPVSNSVINIQMNPSLMSLEEVVVTGYGASNKSAIHSVKRKERPAAPVSSIPLETTTVQQQTTVEFEIETPYNISSDGKVTTIDMRNLELPAEYEYQSVPKIEQEAFLIAKVRDWEQYNLLEGEANLYFENTFVGKSVLDTKNMEDTLEISLGRDRSVVIKREKQKELSSRQFIGNNKSESRLWKITVRNNKTSNINIVLYDQIPVSTVKEIQVEDTELSGGKLNKDTGEVNWKLEIKPKESKELKIGYTVKYPKDKTVVID